MLPAVYFGPGAAVWLVGRDSMHLGASGLVYGMFAGGVSDEGRRRFILLRFQSFSEASMSFGRSG